MRTKDQQDDQARLLTECCGVSIDADHRFCPKCGYEARVLNKSSDSLGVSPAQAREKDLRYALVKVRAHTSYTNPTPELLQGLLASIERIADDALAASPGIAEKDPAAQAGEVPPSHEWGDIYRPSAATPLEKERESFDVQLIASAVVNCHMLARRALARSTSDYDREKWEHVLRICEKAGARSQGVLRASVPTEITDGAEAQGIPSPAVSPEQGSQQVIAELEREIREAASHSARHAGITARSIEYWRLDNWLAKLAVLKGQQS